MEPDREAAEPPRSMERKQLLWDLALGAWLYVVIVLALLFATGEDTSFIYIDF